MDEFDLIDKFLRPIAYARDDVLLGIGDDGALVAPAAGEALLVVTDTLVAGVHFPDSLAAADIGYRALAVNLSDIAAMGGEPKWATLALTLPAPEQAWVQGFAQGLGAALAAHGVALIGGDTTRGALTITVQLIGSVPHDLALRRDGASPGDAVFVSGTLGDASGGLVAAGGGELPAEHVEYLLRRFARPTPRLALGRALRGVASSCIDISDGLLADLGHIAAESGCGARLEVRLLPLSPALLASFDEATVQRYAAVGGDDYELCFTVPPARLASLNRVASAAGCQLTRIGEMTAAAEVLLLDAGGGKLAFATTGFRHFD